MVGSCYMRSGQPDKALEYVQKMLDITDPEKDSDFAGDALLLKANISLQRGDNLVALECYMEVVRLLRRLDQTRNARAKYVGVLNNLSVTYLNLSNMDKALEYGLLCLRENLRDYNTRNELSNYANLGMITLYMNEPVQSLRYFRKACSMARKQNNRLILSKLYNNIGLLSKNQNRSQRAMRYFMRALRIKEEIGDRMGTASLYQNIALLHDEFYNEPDKALEFYRISLRIAEEFKLNSERATTLIYLGNNLTRRKDFESALECLEEALAITREQGNITREMETMKNISNHWLERGDSRKAYEIIIEWVKLKDQQFSTEKSRSLAMVRIQYEVELDLAEPLPRVIGHPFKLEQVLLNLTHQRARRSR